MLQGSDPIVARAAQGSMPMPGPIQATRQSDQVNAMEDFFFKITGNANPGSKSDDERRLAEAIRSFGYKQVRAANGKWELKGMRSTLYNHQLVGVSWMLRQEFSPDGPYGGILADQMGLGKTVQILAAMSANRPNSLVSYNEISNAFPSNTALKEIAGKDLNEEEWLEEYDKLLGELFKIDFFRVVLDEGHAIRNHKTKTARACINLTSKYRWILTGTPLHNNIEEFYAYFRFLGVHWANDLDHFTKQFGNIKEDDARERLNAILTSLMLRRRVDDTFLGVPILEIPPPHPPKMIFVDLTTEERLIYRRLESRFRDNISTHLKAGIAEKKINTYLAYLTRLRQAVAHPFLLEGVLQANFTLEDFHYLRQQLSESGGKTPMHHQVQRWMTMEYEERARREGGTVSFGKSRFGYAFDMNAELEEMEARKSMREVICRICYDVPTDPRITDVKACCPTCKTVLWQVDALNEPDETVDEQSEDENASRKTRRKKKKSEEDREVGDDENLVQPKMKDSSKWVKEYDRNFPDKELCASAKTIAVKNQILIWQGEAPEDKIIVFVNWTKLGCIIGRVLYEEGIRFLYSFGDLTRGQKDAAIAKFQSDPGIKVLVPSIRCGGQALNLSFANRVISVDQWWNTAMENQAFGRVHRIGQDKTTYFVKIAVKDSIDEGLLQMQQGKDRMIAKALQEGVRRKAAPTLEELLRLFGVERDAEGTGGEEAAHGEGEEAVHGGGEEGRGTRRGGMK
ncbi:hypothetical protein NEMBOFW57_006641 [Staphylotrichum longicolle]|uniref:Uncharacterized protein n=1 Tax=Staphylotrichum longicolle TaxID=669026 RepID=A0AAD4ETJ7_9PEZI|nr:hypothetical protein NEMBOFW57_006641 [Staphylotrichum longicolle]